MHTQRTTRFQIGQLPTNEVKTLTSPHARADLRARRKALRVTLVQLGKEAGMRKAQVSRIERGEGPNNEPRRSRPGTVARLVAALDRLEAPALALVQQFAALAELPGHPAFPLASGMVEESILDRIDTAMSGGIMSEHETPAGPTLVVRGGLMALMRVVAPHHYEARMPPCLKTDTRPGTPERLEVYAARFRKGEQLFHDQDAVLEPPDTSGQADPAADAPRKMGPRDRATAAGSEPPVSEAVHPEDIGLVFGDGGDGPGLPIRAGERLSPERIGRPGHKPTSS